MAAMTDAANAIEDGAMLAAPELGPVYLKSQAVASVRIFWLDISIALYGVSTVLPSRPVYLNLLSVPLHISSNFVMDSWQYL